MIFFKKNHSIYLTYFLSIGNKIFYILKHLFQEIKDLTIYGYYTSKIGMEQEIEYGGDDYHTEFPGACNHPEHMNQE